MTTSKLLCKVHVFCKVSVTSSIRMILLSEKQSLRIWDEHNSMGDLVWIWLHRLQKITRLLTTSNLSFLGRNRYKSPLLKTKPYKFNISVFPNAICKLKDFMLTTKWVIQNADFAIDLNLCSCQGNNMNELVV